ncbi:MAG: NAD(P)H-hydrate dehydratase [Betaproteobacteria bacterium]|nr:NAD(P)H-hydrate dehydratase [Betaproteobacteria bacterium]
MSSSFSTPFPLPLPLFRAAGVRALEAAASASPLMQQAGNAAATRAADLCLERAAPVLILAGPGNNGGDAFVAAARLQQRFSEVRLVFAGNADSLPPDAAAAYRAFLDQGGTVLPEIPGVAHWGLIVDGLFGIGLTRPVEGRYAALVEAANALARRDSCPLLALDCPSGLDADTGAVVGAAICATHTLSFLAAKPGLFTADGPDHCGSVEIAPLEPALVERAAPEGWTISPALFSEALKPRMKNSHKGLYGNAGILGGASGMAGAAILAARAALQLGAGRVCAGLIDEHAPAFDPAQPELMLRRPESLFEVDLTALACGPGLGLSDAAERWLVQALVLEIPLVLDADALNLIASDPKLAEALRQRAAHTLLTPHPAEAARLLECGTFEVQRDRLAAACAIAARYRAFTVLKGCGSIVATPDGRWFVNTSGNPGMSSAGMGDVLCGIVLSFLAQGLPPEEALLAATHLHGLAADLVATETGAGGALIGLCASETIPAARRLWNLWNS